MIRRRRIAAAENYGRKGKGREGKGREGKGREGKGRKSPLAEVATDTNVKTILKEIALMLEMERANYTQSRVLDI